MKICSYTTVLLWGMLMHGSCGFPIIGEIVSRMLSPAPLQTNLGASLPQGNLSEITTFEETETKAPAPRKSRTPLPPPLPPPLPIRPRLPPPPPPPPSLLTPIRRILTPLDVTKSFGRALNMVTILGQIDSYIAEKARTIVRKLLQLVDDDSPNAIQGY